MFILVVGLPNAVFGNSLRVCFLEQSRPKLVGRLRVAEEESAISRGQFIADDHVNPSSIPPEQEVKYACMWIVRLPFLFPMICYHLQRGNIWSFFMYSSHITDLPSVEKNGDIRGNE